MYMNIVIKLEITVNSHASALPASAIRYKHINIHIGEITNPTIIDITRNLFHDISKYTFPPDLFILKILRKNTIEIVMTTIMYQ